MCVPFEMDNDITLACADSSNKDVKPRISNSMCKLAF